MKLRKKIHITFILMVVAGTLTFRNVSEAVSGLPSFLGIEPYLIFTGVVYLFFALGIMEYFVLYRIDQLKKDIRLIKDEGFPTGKNLHKFSSKDELGDIICDVNSALHELEKSKKNLQTNNELYMTLVNDDSIYTCRFKTNGEITFINSTFAERFSKTSKDMVGRDIYEIFDATGFDTKELRRSVAMLNPGYTSSNMMYNVPIVLNEDQPKWIAWKVSAVFDERGKAREYQVVGINMHKSPETTVDPEEAEKRANTILLSVEGKIDYMFGSFESADVIGEDILDFIHEDDKWITQKAIDRTVANREESIINARVNFKDKFVYVQMSVNCSIGKDDSLKHIVIKAIDTTEIQGAQEKVVGAVSDMHKILVKNF